MAITSVSLGFYYPRQANFNTAVAVDLRRPAARLPFVLPVLSYLGGPATFLALPGRRSGTMTDPLQMAKSISWRTTAADFSAAKPSLISASFNRPEIR